MTKFNIYIGNHDPRSRESLADHIIWLTAGLEENGHEVVSLNEGQNITANGINIMWEGFIEAYPEVFFKFGEGKNWKYAIICTEHYDGHGFNFKTDLGWMQRWNNFALMAEKAEFIWTYFESDVIPLKRRFNKPVALLELGYTDKLVIPKAPETIFDFTFFGSQNPHRLTVLDRLKDRGYSIYCPSGIVDRNAINGLITHTRINIDAKGPNRIPMPSTARIGRVIHARRGIAMEYAPMQPRPSCFLQMQKQTEDFIDYCEQILHSKWQDTADEVFEKYKTQMPMKICTERAMDLTMSRMI